MDKVRDDYEIYVYKLDATLPFGSPARSCRKARFAINSCDDEGSNSTTNSIVHAMALKT